MTEAAGMFLGWIDGLRDSAGQSGRVAIAGHAASAEALEKALPADPVLHRGQVRLYPLTDWVRTGLADDFSPDLPLRAAPGVAPLLMWQAAGSKDFSPWHPGGADALSRQDLGEVPPLQDRFGEDRSATCAPALARHLFDRPDRRLYAVVDAAAIPDLLPRLAAEELRHESLFQGKAGEDLAEVSPWLVELPADSANLRRLMTQSDRPGRGWYGADGALFLHSRADFDGLRRHLRKFTKLPDENGDWIFLRFWSEQFRDYLANQPGAPLPGAFFDQIEALFCRMPGDRWLRLAATRPTPGDRTRFLPAFRTHARFLLRRRFAGRLAAELGQTYANPPSAPRLAAYYALARARGYRAERAVLYYVETLHLARRLGLDEQTLLARPEARAVEFYSDVGRAHALRDLVQSLEAA